VYSFLRWFFGIPPRRLGTARPRTTTQKALDKQQRESLTAQIPGLLAQWEPILGVKAAQWRIRRMKTRWGSCNTRDKRIWLSLALADKPPRCLEYVLVHELVHLLEPSHNARFKSLMTQYLPDWKQRKKELQ